MSLRTLLSSTALALTLALCACGKGGNKDDGPSCRQVVSYMLRMPGMSAFDERAAIEECRARKLTAKERKCLYSSKDVEAMSKFVPPIKLKEPVVKPPKLPDWHTPLHTPIQGASDRGPAPAAPSAPAPTAPASPPATPAAPAAPATAPPVK